MIVADGSHSLAAIDRASAQHVHQVYTYLDKVGVPGDGFSEGIERTREHRRISASNLLNQVDSNRSGPLSDEEIKILRDADRYGFFKLASSERVKYLHSSQFYPAAGSTSTPVPPNSPSNFNSIKQELYIKETNRIDKWSEMLVVNERDSGSNQLSYRLKPEWNQQRARFEKRCFKGIPDRWRRAAWDMLLEEMKEASNQNPQKTSTQKLHRQFQALLHAPSEQDVQIDLDVPRTINGHIFFHTRYGKGQRALFQVLHTFGMYCKTCGYCQGMGPVASTFLSYFSAEDAFACMVQIHDNYQFHSIFSPGFPGLLECFYIQERLIEYLLPDVHSTFSKQMISSSAYATKWYITIFANTVPYEAQLRLWDIFFLKGLDVLILASVSIVYSLRNHLGPGRDFEQILSTLSGRFEIDNSFSWIRSIRKLLNCDDITNLIDESRLKWKSFVQDGSAPKRIT